jgi:hypothetical protein
VAHVKVEKSTPAFKINILRAMSNSIPESDLTPFLELIPRSRAGPKISPQV